MGSRMRRLLRDLSRGMLSGRNLHACDFMLTQRAAPVVVYLCQLADIEEC